MKTLTTALTALLACATASALIHAQTEPAASAASPGVALPAQAQATSPIEGLWDARHCPVSLQSRGRARNVYAASYCLIRGLIRGTLWCTPAHGCA